MAERLTPAPNIGSQIERALIAYLKTCYGDDAEGINFYFSNDWKTRDVPSIEVLAHKSTETIPHTRNEAYMVRVEWKWKGNNIAGETNPDVNWKNINAFVGTGMAGMSITSADAGIGGVPIITANAITAAGQALATADPTNNADMAEFQCEYVEYKGAQRAEAIEGSFFIKEVRNFEMHAGNYANA